MIRRNILEKKKEKQYTSVPTSHFSGATLNLSQVTNELRLLASCHPLENYVYHKLCIHFDTVGSHSLR